MTWVKIDDNLPNHPKLIAAGPQAAWLYISALCYSSRYGTDGYIPQEAVPVLACLPDALSAAERLCTPSRPSVNPLWEEVEGGYQIHDYLDYQPSAAETRERRRHLSSARAEAGRRGMHSRWSPDETPEDPPREVEELLDEPPDGTHDDTPRRARPSQVHTATRPADNKAITNPITNALHSDNKSIAKPAAAKPPVVIDLLPSLLSTVDNKPITPYPYPYPYPYPNPESDEERFDDISLSLRNSPSNRARTRASARGCAREAEGRYEPRYEEEKYQEPYEDLEGSCPAANGSAEPEPKSELQLPSPSPPAANRPHLFPVPRWGPIRLPSSPYLTEVILDYSVELGDNEHRRANVKRTLGIFSRSGIDEERFGLLLHEAKRRTRKYQTRPIDDPMRSKMAYFFKVLEDLVSLYRQATREQQLQMQHEFDRRPAWLPTETELEIAQ